MLWGLWLRLIGKGRLMMGIAFVRRQWVGGEIKATQCRTTVKTNVLVGRPALEGEISKPYRSNQVSDHFQIINYCLCIPHEHTPSAFLSFNLYHALNPRFFSALLVSLKFCLSRKQDLNNFIRLQHRKISDYVWLLWECYEIFLFHEIL